MAMVISSRAKGMIGAFICLILLSAALVTASTKGWLFGLNKNNGEHVAARIQVSSVFRTQIPGLCLRQICFEDEKRGSFGTFVNTDDRV
jgi:hypothetical protein